jgi:DNA mismatch endonuclease, patch repair protein
MRSVSHSNTIPEVLVRSILHHIGYRFTINAPNNRKLPGKPDIVLPGRKTVVFVHGCFWHGHEACGKYKPPKVRTDFWNDKIERNRKRDKEVVLRLSDNGWKIVVIWECELKKKNLEDLYARIKAEIPELKE